jgi:hypothetical protein
MKQNVLLIEKDERSRKTLGKALKKVGLNHFVVRDATEGMSVLGRASFQVVIIGAGQRRLALQGLCGLARREQLEIPLIIVTADANYKDKLVRTIGHPLHFLDEKCSVSDLLKCVKMIVRKERPSSEERVAQEPVVVPKISLVETQPVPLSSVEESASVSSSQGEAKGSQEQKSDTAPVAREPLREPSVLWEGELEEGETSAVLTTIAVQQLTGRLEIKAEPFNRSYFFLNGEPVWFSVLNQEEMIWTALQASNLLPEHARGQPAPSGSLLSKLVSDNFLTGEALHKFLVSFFRKEMLALWQFHNVSISFFEEDGFIATLPLIKLNVFGLILQSFRSRHLLSDTMSLGDDIEWKYVIPKSGLIPVSGLLEPFCNGRNIGTLITGRRTVRHLVRKLDMDALGANMLLFGLKDARLIDIVDEIPEIENSLLLTEATSPSTSGVEMPHSDIEGSRPPVSPEEDVARDAIFSLYMRVKTLNEAHEILRISKDATREEIEDAYMACVQDLIDGKIHEITKSELLSSRVHEIRQKLKWAREAMMKTDASQ